MISRALALFSAKMYVMSYSMRKVCQFPNSVIEVEENNFLRSLGPNYGEASPIGGGTPQRTALGVRNRTHTRTRTRTCGYG